MVPVSSLEVLRELDPPAPRVRLASLVRFIFFPRCRQVEWPCLPFLRTASPRGFAMPSPFPGMDPFIEGSHAWEDFHHDLITEIKGAISAVLPEGYVVRAGERTYVVLTARNGDQEFITQPDVGVAQLERGRLS